VLVTFDRTCTEALLKQMPDAVMPLVETLRVAEVERMHSLRQAFQRAHHDEVEVVRHQAEREQLPLVLAAGTVQEGHEAPAVVIVDRDRLPRHPASGDVVHAGGR
jgi:hypothetical protein